MVIIQIKTQMLKKKKKKEQNIQERWSIFKGITYVWDIRIPLGEEEKKV